MCAVRIVMGGRDGVWVVRDIVACYFFADYYKYTIIL